MRKAIRISSLVAIAVFYIYPFLWLITTSFKRDEAFTESVLGFPETIYWGNYLEEKKDADTEEESEDKEQSLGIGIRNSSFVSTLSVILNLLLAAPAAYAFSRFKGRLFRLSKFLIIPGLIIPIHVCLIPLLKLSSGLNMYDSLWGLSVIYSAFSLAVSILIIQTTINEIPDELFEAARVDGASDFYIFVKIALPLSIPALVVSAVYQYMINYNEFLFALTLLQSEEKNTLALAMQRYSGGFDTNIPGIAAAICISSIPAILIFSGLQRYLIRGMTQGAVKG